MRKIYDYTCYRKLMADLLAEKNITAVALSNQLGLKSKSYIGLIIRGQKRLLPDQIHLLKDVFQLNATEFEYFFHLVFFCDATLDKAKSFYSGKLQELRSRNVSTLPVVQGQENILSKWYYPALLLNLTLKEPKPNGKLAKIFNISMTELTNAYQDLEKLGVIKKSQNDLWEIGPVKHKIAKRSWSLIQKRFLKEQILNAHSAFDKSYENSGKFYSQTITFSNRSFEEIWDSIKEKMDHLADRSDEEPAEEIFQLNVQFFKI